MIPRMADQPMCQFKGRWKNTIALLFPFIFHSRLTVPKMLEKNPPTLGINRRRPQHLIIILDTLHMNISCQWKLLCMYLYFPNGQILMVKSQKQIQIYIQHQIIQSSQCLRKLSIKADVLYYFVVVARKIRTFLVCHQN